MSYIDKQLLPGEEILYRTRKHFIVFLVPMVWTVAVIFFYFNSNPIITKLTFAPAIAALVTWSKQLLMYATSEFAITNKRVMLKEGFFFRHASELRLTTISNVMSNQSLLGQFLNYGTIIISPFGGVNDIFSEIASPGEFQKQAQVQLDKIIQPRT